MILISLLLLPVLIAIGFLLFGGRSLHIFEFLAMLGIAIVITGISSAIIYYRNFSDTEIWNGIVVNKTREEVHCRHDYCCGHCQSCSSTSCHTYCCSTCYEHPYDVDWNVYMSYLPSHISSDSLSINTVDRQGLIEPPRWTLIHEGDPVCKSHKYINYIKGSPDTLFRNQGLVEKYIKVLPNYPDQIYDIYHLGRVVPVNVLLPDIADWQTDLSKVNATLGPEKQVNIVMVIVTGQPEEYFEALKQHWIGGKKNDAIIVINIKQDHIIEWVSVMAWTDHSIFQVKLRNAILDLKTLDRQMVIPTISEHVDKYYVRKPMADFQYLEASIMPTVTEYAVISVVECIIMVGLGIWFLMNDFEEGDSL